MCTAVAWNGLFGRNLDLWCSYGEAVVITPRRFPFPFAASSHTALIGMAHVNDGYPLYYEAVNEHGLAMAGLNFPHFAVYAPVPRENTEPVPSYALIPYLLTRCKTTAQVRQLLPHITVVDTPFSQALPASPLHWLLTDTAGDTIVLEAVREGLMVYDDPCGVLTNAPPFPYHRARLADYANLQPYQPSGEDGELLYSGGLGAVGLPGDWSSSGRFVRAAYVRKHLVPKDTTTAGVNQFFHMLDSVAMPEGAILVDYPGSPIPGTPTPEKTVYSCVMELATGRYHYKTYDQPYLRTRELHAVEPDTETLYVYPMEIEG